MNLSFSTKGWHNSTFEDFCEVAEYLHFEGIELHNIYNRLFTAKDGAFHDYTAAATLRRLYNKNLKISCLDTISELADKEQQYRRRIDKMFRNSRKFAYSIYPSSCKGF